MYELSVLSSRGSDRVDISTLIGLLNQARRALTDEPTIAGRIIDQATGLLSASDHPERLCDLVTGGLAPWQLKRVRSYVAEELTKRLSTADLAVLVRLSASHFSKAFKISTGVTPHAYVMQQRLDRARALMLGTELPLCEVALACGFADQSHLSRTFKEVVGASPSAWRRATLTAENMLTSKDR